MSSPICGHSDSFRSEFRYNFVEAHSQLDIKLLISRPLMYKFKPPFQLVLIIEFNKRLIIMLSYMKRELAKGGWIRGGVIAIPRSEPSTWMLQSEEGSQLNKIYRESMELLNRRILEAPYVRGESSDLRLDAVTSLGFWTWEHLSNQTLSSRYQEHCWRSWYETRKNLHRFRPFWIKLRHIFATGFLIASYSRHLLVILVAAGKAFKLPLQSSTSVVFSLSLSGNIVWVTCIYWNMF